MGAISVLMEDEEDGNPKNGGSSSNSTVESDGKVVSAGAVRQYVRTKTPRLRWTPDLHCCFVRAVDRLGGADRATPKMVLQCMGVQGMNIAHVKSHLQMYRCKKIDEHGQVIVDPTRNSIDNGESSMLNFRHLQGLHRRSFTNTRYEATSWGSHGYWNPVGSGSYDSVGSWIKNNVTSTHNCDERHDVFELLGEAKETNQYNSNDKQLLMRRRADVDEPDLDLSLSITPRQLQHKRKRGWEVEEEESTLTLSLFPPSSVQKGKHAKIVM